MLKQLTVFALGSMLGIAALGASTAPAMADRGKARWIAPTLPTTYTAQSSQRKTATAQKRSAKRKFDPNVDFETEAVWRNLRPEWFND